MKDPMDDLKSSANTVLGFRYAAALFAGVAIWALLGFGWCMLFLAACALGSAFYLRRSADKKIVMDLVEKSAQKEAPARGPFVRNSKMVLGDDVHLEYKNPGHTLNGPMSWRLGKSFGKTPGAPASSTGISTPSVSR